MGGVNARPVASAECRDCSRARSVPPEIQSVCVTGRPLSNTLVSAVDSGATTNGNTTSYAGAGWSQAPTVETVALPTTSGEAAEGYVVTTWTTDNELNVTTVDGAGQGGARLNGLRVQLASPSSNALYDGEVFSDGTIYFTGVAAGDYKLVIDPAQLAARHLALAGDLGMIHLGRDATRLPSIRLVRGEGR